MSNEENKAVVRSAIDALNQKNWAALYDELTAPDFVLHDASTTIQGLEAYKEFISTFLTAFPDTHFTIEDVIAEGDTVVTRQTFRGTHAGDYGIPPTSKQVTVSAIDITRVSNGKRVEEWFNGDDLGLLQQIGALPTPGQASE
jgi:predicted ester cyclase